MASTTQINLRPRPAHTSGPTYLSYTPNGTKLVTIGSNNTIRVYKTGSDGEPTNIDDCQEQNMAVDSTNEFFVAGSEDGTVSKYSLDTMSFDKFLMRCSLPVRDIAISPDGKWCAVASDELTVKIVNTNDVNHTMYLRDQQKPVKHLSFDPSNKIITLSCTDGMIYVYSLLNEDPELVRTIDGIIRAAETDDEISSKVAWHPDGRAFAAPTATRDIQVISRNDWAKQRIFADGHTGDITALAWSPNGAMLASAGKDKKILLWETKTQKVIATYDHANVMDLAWHPTDNLLSFTNSDGEVYIFQDFVPSEHAHLVKLGRQQAPFVHHPLSETSNNARRPNANGTKDMPLRGARRGSPDSLDDILGSDIMGDEDDFVIDDDGAGYALGLNGNGKRPADDVDSYGVSRNKRHAQSWEPQYHESFQPGSTPWRGDRKYLCLNLIGFIWTIDQGDYHQISAEFYDRETYRDFRFTDHLLYDKACLNENGSLYSCPSGNGHPATILYRPHESWTSGTNRVEWQTELPKGEEVSAIALSDSFVTVTTTKNYVRIYTLFGIPFRVYRQKSSPMVTCASWRDYVLTLGNGPVGADGNTKLLYTIQNIKRDEICQNEDVVALPDGETVKSVFFSDNGDPCIYDSTGTLLTLVHWREPSQASWVPLLDTKLLSRLASGRKTETYFPVAVSDNKFHCIILKGGDKYPYFPRPLLSEFDFQIPISSQSKPDNGDDDDDEMGADEMKKLEGEFALKSILSILKSDLVKSTASTRAEREELLTMDVEIDKTLLRMMMAECIEGEERGMRALEMVQLMKDRTGKFIEAAGKVADKYDRIILGEKIRELGEERLLEMDEE
ncbi:hypothetical protein BOTCAL_0289g00170 [Botryotinia calthae]|uniref:Uncharacterized protein n=1 Tax=Botryotinia calthae TaxID=38488 RepID=A0A4Y8CVH9_9HELO|nr:hypothetical protein BOTCAL_0289g00170 [Botryotinia calthae]